MLGSGLEGLIVQTASVAIMFQSSGLERSIQMRHRPNILHFFVDQQRFDTIGALGNPIIKTPNLDRLCETGVAFTNAFSPSPVCVAARCSMIYGQYPMNTSCYSNAPEQESNKETFMAALTDVGYRTHGIGKCHFTPDPYALRGFQSREVQEEMGARSLENEPYLKELHDRGYKHILEPFGMRGEMYYIPQPSQLPADVHPSQWVGDRSIAFIKEQGNSDDPWYLFSSFIHPHPPFTPPSPWYKLYRAPQMPLPNVPADFESLQTYVNRCQNRYKYRDQGIDQNLIRCMKAFYYACISFVDYQIGRVLDALRSTGQLDNTLIVFTSDHGELLGDYNCFGKRSMHDGSVRIPMILSMPGRFEGGEVVDTPVSLIDLAPTFLNIAGTSISTHKLDGVDLADVMSKASKREMVFAQHSYSEANVLNGVVPIRAEYWENPDLWRAAMSQYMAVTRDWKYFYSAPDNKEFLFDKITDPNETRNKAGNPFYADILASARKSLIAHLKSGGEVAGIDGDTWRRFDPPEFPDNPDAGLLVQDVHTPWAGTVPGY